MKTSKIEPIWSELRGAKYFTSLVVGQDIIIFQSTKIQDQRQYLFAHTGNSNIKE